MHEKRIEQYSINVDTSTLKRGFFIFNQDTSLYVYKDESEHSNVGHDTQENIFWDDINAAIVFVNKILGIEDVIDIFTTVEIEKWRVEKTRNAIAEVIEFFMNEKITFTRHDVVRAVRVLFGEGIEVEYSIWKDVIIDYIETARLNYFDYSKINKAGRWEYVFISSEVDEAEEDDSIEDDSIEDEEVVEVDSEPKVKTKHIISSKIVRDDGLLPGDVAIFKALDNCIIFGKTEKEVNIAIMGNGSCPIADVLYTTKIKVDKSGNIQLRKKIFEMANMPDAFFSSNWVN